MSESWLDSLNGPQREAVTHGAGPLLVVAGAGTGKTRTLACRVAWLIESGVPPDRILLLTFTRRAAAEMIHRADQLTGRRTTTHVWGGTFHAVAHRLLRFHGQALGLPPGFSVIDAADAADLLNLTRNDLGLAKKDRRFPRKETLQAIYSRTVNSTDKLTDILTRHWPWCEEYADPLRDLFDAFTRRKRERNVLDYDDLLLLWRELHALSGAGDEVAERFDHVLVDEYQDTNALQAEILLGLRRENHNIMVVGDDAQSIYSFRAATVRNILDFPKQFPGTHIVTLEQNYRSTEPILAASNAVMAPARERFTKNLWSQRPSEQKPVLYTCMDEAEQCRLVCERILAHLEMGTLLRKQAVLFRAGHHSDQLEVELTRCKIPFHKYGGLKFVEAAHVKDLLALLRILENPYDELSWFRVLLLIEGIGPKSARRIMEALGVHRAPGQSSPAGAVADGSARSPWRCLAEESLKVPPAAREMFGQLRTTLLQCVGMPTAPAEEDDDLTRPTTRGTSVAAQIEKLRQFYEPIVQARYDNWVIRLRDIEQLEQIAARYRSRNRFIADLTLDPPASTADLAGPPLIDEDYLILSTIHSAKGCEWDVVHIIHAADGMIPSDMATENEAGVDEERRLFYVAMTRARDMLYIYFPLRYYHRRVYLSDAHSYAQLTRFLPSEIHSLLELRTCPAASIPRRPTPHIDLDELDRRLKHRWRE